MLAPVFFAFKVWLELVEEEEIQGGRKAHPVFNNNLIYMGCSTWQESNGA